MKRCTPNLLRVGLAVGVAMVHLRHESRGMLTETVLAGLERAMMIRLHHGGTTRLCFGVGEAKSRRHLLVLTGEGPFRRCSKRWTKTRTANSPPRKSLPPRSH
jgi:hypothetical protein